MAKKFIKVEGLTNIFNVVDGKLVTTSLKSDLSVADEHSVFYIIATEDDEPYGYTAGKTYTYANGIFENGNGDIIDVEELPEANLATSKDIYRDSNGRLWQAIVSEGGDEELVCTFASNGSNVNPGNTNVFPSENVSLTEAT